MGLSLLATREGANFNAALLEGGHLAVQTVPNVAPFLPAANYVTANNPAILPAVNPLIFAAPAITAKGSGVFRVSANCSPVIAAASPEPIAFTLWRDAVQLPPQAVTAAVNPGNAGPASLEWIDAPGDSLPHVYSVQMAVGSNFVFANANQCSMTVQEL